jgi:hypothetical protein
MIYVDPLPTLEANVLAGTNTAEPSAGEVLWVANTAHVLGDLRVRTTTHRVYRCVQAHGARAAFPENDPTFWLDYGPTLRWSPFDYYASTSNTTSSNDITYVVSGRFVNALWLDGLLGSTVTVTVKNQVGGSVVFTKVSTLKRAATGYWDYAYGQKYFDRTLLVEGLPIYPEAEITVTVSGSSGSTRAIGSLVRGKVLSLAYGDWGGTQWGAKAVPKTYTYRKVRDDGTFQIIPRGSAVDLDCSVQIKVQYADLAVESLTGLMGRPVVWIATRLDGFKGLRTFGFAQKPSVAYNQGFAEISNYIDGIVST